MLISMRNHKQMITTGRYYFYQLKLRNTNASQLLIISKKQIEYKDRTQSNLIFALIFERRKWRVCSAC